MSKKPVELSVSMIVKNEEAMLMDCLNSIKDADQICITDTGSEDDTLKVIEKFKKTYKGELILNHFKWIDDFSSARNYALQFSTKEWILIIDADEIMEKGGIQMIKKRLPHYNDPTLKLKVKTDFEELMSPRVFKNNEGIHWLGAIHNRLSTNEGGQLSVLITARTSPTHEKDPERTIRILTKELTKNPNDKRNQYYIAREFLNFQNIPSAVFWFERRVNDQEFSNERADAYYLLGTCYSQMNMQVKAVEAWAMCILINPHFKAAFEALGKSFTGENGKRWTEMSKTAKNLNMLFLR